MNGRITRRRRLFVLLAGFFGFVTSTAVPGVSGVAVADAISTNTASAADPGGGRNAIVPAAIPGRDHRPPLPTDIAPGPWGRASAAVSSDRCWNAAASTASRELPCGLGAAVSRDSAPDGPERVVLAITAEHAAAPPAVFLATVQVRGPPSITGSHVPVR